MTIFNNCLKNKKVKKFLLEGKDHPKSKGRDLQAFLIQPIQRIPRYSMLLNDLLKNTWSDHPDIKNLEKANDEIQKIATFLNEKKREAENMSKVTQIQEIINRTNEKFNLISAGRVFLFEGDAIDRNKKKDISLYLFNNLIVEMEVLPKPKDYKAQSIYEDEERLKFIKFKDSFVIDESFTFVTVTPNEDSLQSPPFTITLYLPQNKVFSFGFATEKNFLEWKKQIENLSKKFETSKISKEQAKGKDSSMVSINTPTTPTATLRPEEQLYNNRKKKLSIGPVTISQDLKDSSPSVSPSVTPKSSTSLSVSTPLKSNLNLRRSTISDTSDSSLKKNGSSSTNVSPTLEKKSANNSFLDRKSDNSNLNNSQPLQKIQKTPKQNTNNNQNTNTDNINQDTSSQSSSQTPSDTLPEKKPQQDNNPKTKKELEKEKKERKKKEKELKKEQKKKEKEKKKGRSRVQSKEIDEEWEKIIQNNLIKGPKVKKDN